MTQTHTHTHKLFSDLFRLTARALSSLQLRWLS